MEPLTGKQRRHLRALANHLKPTVHIGKESLTPELIAEVEREFEYRELIKLHVNQNCERSAKELAPELAEAAHAHWVQTVGRAVVIYRALDPPEIHLPG